MPKYATLDFDPTDTQDQFAIVYNDYADGGGDCRIDWFDTEELRAIQVGKDIKNGVVFLSNWEVSYA